MELKGLKADFLGDSITEGVGASSIDKVWWKVLEKETGIIARGYGVGGTRIARQQSASANERWDHDFNERMLEMDKDADIIGVFGGTNDYGHGDAKIGNPSDTDPYTFYGGLNNLIEKLGRIYGKDGISVKFSNISAKYSSSSSNRGGLFGEIGDNAVIENVAFENVTVEIAASGSNVSDIKYGLFAGNVSEKADMTGVSLTGATLKISGGIDQPSGDYRIHLLANGAIDKIAADFETFGLEVCGQDIGGMYFYSFNPEEVSVEADGSIKLTFVGFEEFGEKSYSIKERR